MFLYVITNLVNGKQYVGITVNTDQRRREHYSGHGSKLVRQAIRKYGRENLALEVWYEGDADWIKAMEYRAIVMLETRAPKGYNLTLGGEGSVGWRPDENTRQKMSVARSGDRNGMWARRHSPATRQKMRTKALERPRSNRAMPLCINGAAYDSIKAAAKALGLSYNGLCMKVREFKRSGTWPEYLQFLSN